MKPTKPRAWLLELALESGAVLTGKPDGSEAVTVQFPVDAWQKFDKALLAKQRSAGAQGEPVAEVTAKMILDQEWRIYAYKVGQLMVGTKLYAKAPAAAINEQLLEAAKELNAAFDLPVFIDRTAKAKLKAARDKFRTAIAEAEKAKGGAA